LVGLGPSKENLWHYYEQVLYRLEALPVD